jgi:hypothetical protein
MIPPPPSAAGSGGSFSLDALFNAIKAELTWLGQVARAPELGRLHRWPGQGRRRPRSRRHQTRPVPPTRSVLRTTLPRMALVMSGYAGPFNEDYLGGRGLDRRPVEHGIAQPAGSRSSRWCPADRSPTPPLLAKPPYFVCPRWPRRAVWSTFPAQVMLVMPEDMLDCKSPRPTTCLQGRAGAHDGAPAQPESSPHPLGRSGQQRYFSIMANCERRWFPPHLRGHRTRKTSSPRLQHGQRPRTPGRAGTSTGGAQGLDHALRLERLRPLSGHRRARGSDAGDQSARAGPGPPRSATVATRSAALAPAWPGSTPLRSATPASASTRTRRSRPS